MPDNAIDAAPLGAADDEIERGLRFGHIMMMVGQSQGNEAIAAVMALTDLLVQKSVLTGAEFAEAQAAARERVASMAQPRVRLATMGDKYADAGAVEIDCHARLHLCQARCCSFNFYLTAQDLDEGVAQWDYGNPYWIRHGADGYCVHCHPESRACAIHAQRPHVCRLYDCRTDKRVWIDFEARIPAPMDHRLGPLPIALAEPDLARNLMEAPSADDPAAPAFGSTEAP